MVSQPIGSQPMPAHSHDTQMQCALRALHAFNKRLDALLTKRDCTTCKHGASNAAEPCAACHAAIGSTPSRVYSRWEPTDAT